MTEVGADTRTTSMVSFSSTLDAAPGARTAAVTVASRASGADATVTAATPPRAGAIGSGEVGGEMTGGTDVVTGSCGTVSAERCTFAFLARFVFVGAGGAFVAVESAEESFSTFQIYSTNCNKLRNYSYLHFVPIHLHPHTAAMVVS